MTEIRIQKETGLFSLSKVELVKSTDTYDEFNLTIRHNATQVYMEVLNFQLPISERAMAGQEELGAAYIRGGDEIVARTEPFSLIKTGGKWA